MYVMVKYIAMSPALIVQVILHHQSLLEQAVITNLVAQLHKGSGEVVKRRPRCLARNSNAVVELQTSHPICIELYKDIRELGRFMLRAGGVTIAAGLVTQVSVIILCSENWDDSC
jgi:elongation factor 1 alpha-like protein